MLKQHVLLMSRYFGKNEGIYLGRRRCSCAEVVLSTGCGDRPTHRDHKEATRNLKQQRKPCARMTSRSARS